MLGERRQSDRHRIRFKLVYDDGNSFNAGTVGDVSTSGLFLETALPLDVGTIVRITPLDSVDDELFEVTARVVRVVSHRDGTHERPGMGLEFMDLTPTATTAVVRLIEKLEKRAAKGVKDLFLGVVLPRAAGGGLYRRH